MKLYYKPGACSLASHIVLHEIGAPFEIEKVDTHAQRTESGADFAAISPNGYVPVLELSSGERVSEGAAVLQYLADENPDADLAPAPGTMERTRLIEVLNFTASELHKAFSPLFSDAPPTGAEADAVKAKLGRRMDHLERLLSDGRQYLIGARFTVADAYAFVVSSWANYVGIGLDDWPNIAAFVMRIGERPSVRQAMRAENLIR